MLLLPQAALRTHSDMQTCHAAARGLRQCLGRSWLHSRQGCTASQRIMTAAAAPSDESRQIQPPDVPELARLAHIAVTDEEVKDWAPKIESIVEWFGQLQEVDVEGVPPALRAEVEAENFLRQDEPRQYEHRDELVQQFPLTEGRFLKVPKIVTAADS